jgi:hypothetical protein
MDIRGGKSSSWLLRNSSGEPDFLFTVLTYCFLLLTLVALVWLSFSVLVVLHAKRGADTAPLIDAMKCLQTGLISLAGLAFGLAGSYTVRRFKKDELDVALQAQRPADASGIETTGAVSAPAAVSGSAEFQPVLNQEDI